MAIMQAKLALSGDEILFAADALGAIARRYRETGSGGMARPYEDIIERIDEARKHGGEAAVDLAGGAVDCMSFALSHAGGGDMAQDLLARLRKATRGLTDPSMPHDGT